MKKWIIKNVPLWARYYLLTYPFLIFTNYTIGLPLAIYHGVREAFISFAGLMISWWFRCKHLKMATRAMYEYSRAIERGEEPQTLELNEEQAKRILNQIKDELQKMKGEDKGGE